MSLYSFIFIFVYHMSIHWFYCIFMWHFQKKFQISVGPCLPQNNLHPYISVKSALSRTEWDSLLSMSRYNFLMTIQGAKALKNPLNFLNTVIPPFWCQEKNHARWNLCYASQNVNFIQGAEKCQWAKYVRVRRKENSHPDLKVCPFVNGWNEIGLRK